MNNLQKLREAKGLNKKETAKELGIPYTTYVNYEKGARDPNSEVLIMLATYFNTTIDYILGRVDDPKASEVFLPITTVQKPLLGAIACGTPILAVENVDTEIDVPTEFASCDFALRCKGDSMDGGKYPIRDGSIVYIKEQPVVDDGQIAAVLIGEEATLKIVYWNEQAHTLTLLPQNPSYSPIVVSGPDLELEGVRILGRAIGYTASIA